MVKCIIAAVLAFVIAAVAAFAPISHVSVIVMCLCIVVIGLSALRLLESV